MTLTCKQCGNQFESKRSSRSFCSCECSNKANGTERANKEIGDPVKTLWSCGGGVQSTAIAVLIEQGKLPKPDYAVMVDCGYESKRTMDYVHNVIQARLHKVGVDLQIISTLQYSNNNIMSTSGHCNLPAYIKKSDGTVGKLPTHCNGAWKVAVQQRFLREQGVKLCDNWIGISSDEERRGNKPPKHKWIYTSYPLLKLGLTRDDCLDLIQSAGWDTPMRTSCIFCPNRSNNQWLKMYYEEPDEFKQACEIEKQIQLIQPNVYLTSYCVPLKYAIERL